jgi:DNA polymerase alpha subunit B
MPLKVSLYETFRNALVLDDRIDSMAEILQEQYSSPEEHFNNPSRPSPVPSALFNPLTQNEIIAVGRICVDPPSTTARLPPQVSSSKTSRRLGAGARVPLNLSSVPSFALFPGQLVGVRGVNASGEYLAVQEILLPQPMPWS